MRVTGSRQIGGFLAAAVFLPIYLLSMYLNLVGHSVLFRKSGLPACASIHQSPLNAEVSSYFTHTAFLGHVGDRVEPWQQTPQSTLRVAKCFGDCKGASSDACSEVFLGQGGAHTHT